MIKQIHKKMDDSIKNLFEFVKINRKKFSGVFIETIFY